MKFKLNKNDFKSLKNSVSLIKNPVLKEAAMDVSNSQLSGGYEASDFAKCGKAKIIWAQA